MDKMREEFEAWYGEQFKYSDKKLTSHGETYLSPFVGGLWSAWQASRAAMRVELPRIADFAKDSRGAREVLNSEFAVECVARELNDVGVRHE